MDKDKLKSVVESLLLASGEPIKLAKLSKTIEIKEAEIKEAEIKEAVSNLSNDYKERGSGLAIIKKEDRVQLVTNPENSTFVESFLKVEIEGPLSQAALEVISIVAYKGPISKSEIESIRGVNCSYTLRNLLIRGLIERKNNPRDSRGYLYEISFDFLKKLGVEEVKNLPDYDKLSIDQRIDSIITNE